jgi:hypothetical protein
MALIPDSPEFRHASQPCAGQALAAQANRQDRAVGRLDCAANVDAPLAEAVDLLHALLVMGYGMIDNNEDGGRPVVAVTGAVWERLNAVRDAWREVVDTAQRQMR